MGEGSAMPRGDSCRGTVRLRGVAPGGLSQRGLFVGNPTLHKAPPQGLAARQQTEMRVRQGKYRKEGEGHPATATASATDPNPVMMLVVRLLATMSVTNDRIAFTRRALA